MVGVLYLQYVLLALALVVWAAHLWRSVPTLAAALAVVVAAGLLYDNLVLAVGAVLDAGPLLLALNWPRYWLEALVAPLFVPIAANLARRAGAAQLGAHATQWLVGATTLALMLYGLAGLNRLVLMPVSSGGAVRYVATVVEPPVIGLACTFAALVAGVAIWRARGWSWLTWAALVVFVAGGAAAAFGRDAICVVTNTVEMLPLVAMLAWERHLCAEDAAQQGTPVSAGH